MRVRPAIVVLLMILSFTVAVLTPTMLGVEQRAISQTVREVSEKANLQQQAEQLFEQGTQLSRAGKTTDALQAFERAIMLFKQLGDEQKEGWALGWMAGIHERSGDLQRALKLHQQALAIAKRVGDRLGEGATFNNIGWVYANLGQYSRALEFYQQALSISKQVNNRSQEGAIRNNIGWVYANLGQYSTALESYQQALVIIKEVGNRFQESAALNNIGWVYSNLGQYDKALKSHQQALAISREVRDRPEEGRALRSIGEIYAKLGQYDKTLEFYQQALAFIREVGDRPRDVTTLNDIGLVYENLGQYREALEFYQEALAITEKIGNQLWRGRTLNNIGTVYASLGQYDKALEFHQQALAISKEVRDRLGEGMALNSIGQVYTRSERYREALEFHQQALKIIKEIGDRLREGTILNDIGATYAYLEQYAIALALHQQALAIHKESRHRPAEGSTLHNIGIAYTKLGQYAKALEVYQQALAIRKKDKLRPAEGETLYGIGCVLEAQGQAELATVFFKQSVNTFEIIRTAIRKLPKEQQESYTRTVESAYRKLADLLLSQGRVLEAQQVLELLKIQELRNYTQNARAGGETQGAPLSPIEAPVIPPYNNLIALGRQLTDCESKRPYCAERDRLIAQRIEADKQFQQQVDRLRKLARVQERDPAQLQQEELTRAAQEVILAQPNSVLIYPLVLEDKLWLVWGTRTGQKSVSFVSEKAILVSREELSKTVLEFRSLLSKRGDVQRLKQVSRKLYGWLLEPIRQQIDDNGIQNLVFSLDRSTRYIPMQALFDGKQYLIENFGVSTILTAGLTDTNDRLSSNISENPVLGLGLSDRTPDFEPLPNVKTEVDAIVRTPKSNGIFPGLEFLNKDFTRDVLQKHLIDHRILHIATHGEFLSDNPKESFLVLGNGEKLKIPDIQTLKDLSGVHLVVLSACKTAEGGQDKEGIEVSGISFYFLNTGAKSVVGSLWQVNDASTSLLMQKFYQNLSTGKMTKTQAMQQAQIQFIRGQLTAKDAPKRAADAPKRAASIHPASDQADPPTASTVADYTHPYYWSPFILIGNGL